MSHLWLISHSHSKETFRSPGAPDASEWGQGGRWGTGQAVTFGVTRSRFGDRRTSSVLHPDTQETRSETEGLSRVAIPS